MGFRRAGNVFKDFLKGNFYFGRTLTNRFSDSRATGIFDGLAGAGLGYYSVMSGTASVLKIGALAAAVTTAPVSAAIFIPVSVLFLGLSCCLGAMSLGLLDSAREKAGIPKPPMPPISGAIGKVGDAVSGGAGAVKNIFKTGAKKLSSTFSSAVLRKKPKPSTTPKLKIDKDFKL